jgi:RNA polymerase sigma-70 factor (ECF subfamily)
VLIDLEDGSVSLDNNARPKKKAFNVNPLKTDEATLLKRAIHRKDRRALSVLYARYYLDVKRYMASCLDSVAEAEDLAQNVFVELCRGNGSYDGRTNAKGYLLGIARNTVRRYLRKKTRRVRTFSAAEEIDSLTPGPDIARHQDPARRVADREIGRIIRDAVAQLPPKARQAVKLRFVDGLSSKEAAKEAGCSVGTLYERISTALKELRKSAEKSDHGRAS